jgi:peptidoglycan DL-endopeptidase CwlO
MLIHPDVQRTAKWFGVNPSLVQAVMNAEGGPDALIRAVNCSLRDVTTLQGALEVTCRTIAHRLSDYVLERRVGADFVAFLGQRWAPLGAENDPNNLNANWVPNVLKFWEPPAPIRKDSHA